MFYGDGGEFRGDLFDRWETALEGGECQKYIGGTGATFSLSGDVRSRGRRVFLQRRIPFATVTDDRIVRGFVTTGSWFGMKIAAFSWAEVPQAAAWLELTDDQCREVCATLAELRLSVDGQLRIRRMLDAREDARAKSLRRNTR